MRTPQEQEIGQALFITLGLLQEHADDELRMLGGHDAPNVEFHFGGVHQIIQTRSAITYWRVIKGVAARRIAQLRSDIPLKELFPSIPDWTNS